MFQKIEGMLSGEKHSYGIVVSRFNNLVTNRLLDGAVDCLVRHGVNEAHITVVYCPGSFEIPQVAAKLAASGKHDGIICLGCVIRGDTPHFDYVAAEVTKGIGTIALETGVPVSFGVLTTDNLQQALERAGAKAGNKGWDAALTALELVNTFKKLSGEKNRSNS